MAWMCSYGYALPVQLIARSSRARPVDSSGAGMPGSRRLADHPACNGPSRTQPFIVSGGCSRPKPLCGDPAILGPTLVAPNLAGEAGSLELGEAATSIFDYPHAHRRSRPRGSKGPVRRRTTRTFSGHHPEFFGKPRKQEARGSSGPDALERWFRSSALRATSCMLHRKTLPPDERIAVQLIARARRPAGRRRILRIGIASPRRPGRVCPRLRSNTTAPRIPLQGQRFAS